jgi:FkbM family methyltransferase
LTIFEIGVCEGEDTIRFRRRFPRSTIYAFEPLPKNIKRITKNLKSYDADRISLHQIALSNENGHSDFFVSSGHPDSQPKTGWDFGNKSSSLLKPKEHLKTHKWMKFKDKISVKTRRLDSFCTDHAINKIDFIYMDVQGAELMVLEGAGNLIRKTGAIWLEVEAVELYAKQPLKDDVEAFMQKHGFKCIKDTVGEVAGDRMYVRKHSGPYYRLFCRRLLGKLNRPWGTIG